MTNIYRKTRPDDVLGNLSSDDQEKILSWCDDEPFRDVLKKIAVPPPEGLGLHINYGTLRNFYLKNLPLRMAMKPEDILEDWEILVDQITKAHRHPEEDAQHQGRRSERRLTSTGVQLAQIHESAAAHRAIWRNTSEKCSGITCPIRRVIHFDQV